MTTRRLTRVLPRFSPARTTVLRRSRNVTSHTAAVIAPRIAQARARARARARQAERYASAAGESVIRTNAEADGQLLERVARPDVAGSALLAAASEHMRLSARGYHRILRVARTIADLEGTAAVGSLHVA
ncbi:MAG: hypothetical protein EXQ90_00245 [Rhodospirillales bacterium]|nr:hypothetical protein [Rhodospirillales bacterium]